jgi:hypothetical protein
MVLANNIVVLKQGPFPRDPFNRHFVEHALKPSVVGFPEAKRLRCQGHPFVMFNCADVTTE